MCSFALRQVKQTVFIISNQLSVPVLLFNISGMQSKYWPALVRWDFDGLSFFQVPTTRHCLADRLFIVLCPVNCWWCYGAVLPVTHTSNENVNAKDFQILWKSWGQMREPFPLMSAQGEHFSRLTFFVRRNDSDRRMMVEKENNDGGNDAERLTVVPVPNCPRTSSKSRLAAASRGQGWILVGNKKCWRVQGEDSLLLLMMIRDGCVDVVVDGG